MLLPEAQIEWRDGHPRSVDYDDVYFSTRGGLAETEHVFIEGNDLRRRLSRSRNFTVGEVGFGSGLNFLATCLAWRNCGVGSGGLHYVAVEQCPLSKVDLVRCCGMHPELSFIAGELLAGYPPPLPGYHRIILFGGRIRLTLLYGDAVAQLAELQGQVDAWFLDGFSPARNPDAWSNELLELVAANTSRDGTFATYSAAGSVRRGLERAGFCVEKAPGFAAKREMLRGHLRSSRVLRLGRPWFHVPVSRLPPSEPVAVLGAGLAGSACAFALADRGIPVQVFETGKAAGQGASGNPAGIVMPFLSADHNLASRFYLTAYQFGLRHLDRFSGVNGGLGQGGVVQLAWPPGQAKRNQAILDRWGSGSDLLEEIDPDEGDWVARGPSLLYPGGGWLAPRSLCENQLGSAGGVRVRYGATVRRLEKRHGRWFILDQSGGVISTAGVVVLCQGPGLLELAQCTPLELGLVGGLVSRLPASQSSNVWRRSYCFDGYLTPARDGFHTLGATFDREEVADNPSETAGHRSNLERLMRASGGGFPVVDGEGLCGRYSYRVVSRDRLPVVGPVPEWGGYLEGYADLRKGYPASRYPEAPYQSGLYISAAHGSRGLISTILAAELLASQICGEPAPLERSLLHAVHPARFLIRRLLRSRPSAGITGNGVE